MADLTLNTPRKFQGAGGPIVEYPMAGNLRVFAGAALMGAAADGSATNCTPTASGEFLGFAAEEVDNRTGSVYGGTAGSTTVPIQMSGLVWLTVAHTGTYVRTDSGATVYASDGNTFTLSAGTNNIVVGKVVLVPEAVIGAASGEVLVYFEATALRSI